MSFSTWTSTAVASKARRCAETPWRAVEAQHRAATMSLADSLCEQAQLEALLETSKPPIPAQALGLHWLLFTPFRYPTSQHGSRFRRPFEPGVFYAAHARRTACAELGYWRWRFLSDAPALGTLDSLPQTLFQVVLEGSAADVRDKAFMRQRAHFEDRSDYRHCQAFANVAREAKIEAIVYRSVRDPQQGGCIAVLAPSAFAKPAPIAQETWTMSVTPERVFWQKSDVLSPEDFEFEADLWR